MGKWTWEVKSNGRFERIAVFYIALLVITILFLIYEGLISLEDNSTRYNMFGLITFFIIVGIPTLIATIPKLLKSNIPKKVKIDADNEQLIMFYGKNHFDAVFFDELAYSFNNKYSHNYLILYRTFAGTRGQLVKKKMTEMIGMEKTRSWKIDQIDEIGRKLQELGIQSIVADNKDLPLWERMLS